MMGAVVSAVGVLALIFIGYMFISSAQNFGNAANASYVPEAATNAGMTQDTSFSMFTVMASLLGVGCLLLVGYAIVTVFT